MKTNSKYVIEFSEHLKTSGKLQATIESYCRDARNFIAFLESHQTTVKQVFPETLIEYKTYLESQSETQNTIRRATIGVRQFFRFLVSKKIISSSPFEMVTIPQRNEDLPKQLSCESIESLIQSALCNGSNVQAKRNALIICLFAYDGLKATEIINLSKASIVHSHDCSTLKIGGSKARVIKLNNKTGAAAREYEKGLKLFFAEKNITPGNEYHYLIAFKGKDQAVVIPKLSRHGLKFIIYELGMSLNIDKLNGEQLRHFALEYMINKGMSPEDIMGHLGLKRLGNIAKHLQPKRISHA